MRMSIAVMLGAVALAASTASAAPINAPAIGAAAEQVGIIEPVHCRQFRHWHRWGYGRGCGGGVVVYGPRYRSSTVIHGSRFGGRYHDGGFRTERRSGVTIRGEERTRFRGGVVGETSPRGSVSGGGQVRERGGGGRTDSGGGRSMNSAPAAQQGSGGAPGGGAATGR